MNINPISLPNVDRGEGKYKATITASSLVRALKKGYIMYSPATQRGLRDDNNPDGVNENIHELFPITYEHLNINMTQVHQMAYLILTNKLFWDDVIWNVRHEKGYTTIKYDVKTRSMAIDGVITMPDSAHRHRAYLEVFEWLENPNSIPNKIVMDEQTVTKDEIKKLLKSFNKEKTVFVTVHNISPTAEGILFRQLNRLNSRINNSMNYKVAPEATPLTRFVTRLIEKGRVFAKNEIEMNRTSVHRNSRKLVPNSTLQSSIRSSIKDLLKYENQPKAYDDLVDFVDEFFFRLASHYPEMKPEATKYARELSRENSYIIKNIMFFPLMKIAYELWETYFKSGKGWRRDKGLDQLIAKLAKDVEVKDDKKRVIKKVNIMSKENKDWIGVIVNEKFQITSNRPSQQDAFEYLAKEIGLNDLLVTISDISSVSSDNIIKFKRS